MSKSRIVVLLVVGEAEASPVLVVYMLLIILERLAGRFSRQDFTHSAGASSSRRMSVQLWPLLRWYGDFVLSQIDILQTTW